MDIVAGNGRSYLRQLFHDFATPVTYYSSLTGSRLQPVLVSQFETLLTTIVNIGKSDQVRHHLARRVKTVIFALQVNALDTRRYLTCELGFELAPEINEFTVGALLEHGHGIAVIKIQLGTDLL